MANTGTFRSAINGFNRQDVMDYLESASQRYETLKKERNELDRMRAEQLNRVKELEGVQEEAAAIKEQAAQEVAEALEQLRVKEEECESLRASLESVTAERDAALAKPAEDPAVAEELRSEISALKARLTELEASQAGVIQKAQEYDNMRERIATLELNASRRAADIEEAARGEARALIEQAEQQARELTLKAEQDAEALLNKAKAEEAGFLAQREENYRSFRESLHGAAQETEAGVGLISGELQRLGDKLKELVGSLTGTALRFETPKSPEAEETCCCEAEDGKAECCESEPCETACCEDGAQAQEEIHHCHE